MLRNGKWVRDAADFAASDGRFHRATTAYRNWITPDGRPGPTGSDGFPAESGRYHLYVSYACPWAHRTLILRALKGLERHVSVDVVHPLMGRDGWSFATDFPGATGDSLGGAAFLREVYLRADPQATARVTVPVLWDRQRQTIVSNESADIMRMFNSAFDAITGDRTDYYPASLRPEIDALNARIYETLNNGVYRAGFATTKPAYDEAVGPIFETLDWLETRLSQSRYLAGVRVTEADWRLVVTLFRFDSVYHGHFKCNRHRIVDYPNLWGYTKELWQMPGVGPTLRLDHVVHHYHRSHPGINPHGIVPVGPDLDFAAPHGRERLLAA